MRKLSLPNGGVDFASNDYLGFARSEELIEQVQQKWATLNRLGATGSRLLTGNCAYAEALENKIAAFHGEEAGLLFSSGYQANLGLIQAVAARDHTILYDEKVHASIRDGIVLSRARAFRFFHNDLDSLEAQLKRPGTLFVCIESVYSTDGSLAPLEDIRKLCGCFGAYLIVDEAHATGVFGTGRVREPVFARMHSFGKALGVHGAIVVGSAELRSLLINYARPFIYSTAMPLYALAAIEAAYEKLGTTDPSPLHALMHHAGLPSPIGTAPLQGYAACCAQGFDVRPLRYPTVARGEECLRFCLHTYNTKEEWNALAHCLWN